MTQRNPWQSYRTVATQTASPGQLVLMLFDGAVRFLEKALQGFSHEDPLEFNQAIGNNILRAQAIVNELDYSLDLERGGELAGRMRSVYRYIDWRLQESNVQKSREGIEDAIQRLTILREAWREMLETGAAVEPAAASQPG